MWCYDPSELKDFCASIKEKPLLPAVVRLVKPDGSVADSRTMERSLAKMATHYLYGSKKPTYFITVDYSIGMGSYNGPITFLVELNPGKLQWLKALDTKDRKEREITLMRSLKSEWRLVPSIVGTGQDIVKLACRPFTDPPDVEFEVIYTRFHCDGGHWLKLEPGYFENEGDFPSRDEFP